MDSRSAKMPLLATDGVAWTGLIAGPLAWFLHQAISYVLVPWSCNNGRHLPLHLVSAAMLLLALAGGAVSWRDWSRRREASSEDARAEGRAQFLAATGLAMCALFALAILLQAAASFYFDPCQR